MNMTNDGSARPALWRVCVAAVAGSTIEGFDFLAYGTASALVFGKDFSRISIRPRPPSPRLRRLPPACSRGPWVA